MKININKKKCTMIKPSKLITYIIILIFFLSYLVFATSIVSVIMPNSVKKVNIDIDTLKKDPVLYSLDNVEYLNDFYGNMQLSGWAFSETLEDNTEKEIWLIFKSEKSTYMFKNELQSSEINNVFKSTYDIRGNNHRFGNTVSTAVMKNGLYKIYIYCKENNKNYGLVDTNKMIKKDSNGVSEYVWHSSPQGITETEIGVNTKCTIDSVTNTDEGYTQIAGWAFTEGLDTNGQSVYVRLTYEDGDSVTYDTQSISRPDVGAAYKSQLYNNCGFRALIQSDELQGGNILVEILVSNSENVYLAPQISKYTEGFSTREILQNRTPSVSTETKIDFQNISVDTKVNYWIDKCVTDKALTINGWGFITDAESAETKIYLAVTSADGVTHVYSTVKGSRPDVAKVFESDLYVESGFSAEIPLNAIKEGDNTFTVIADNGQMLKASTSYTFNYKVGDDN